MKAIKLLLITLLASLFMVGQVEAVRNSEIKTVVDANANKLGALVAKVDLGWQHLSVTTGLQAVDSTWSSVATHVVFTISRDIEYEITVTCDVSFTGADSLFIGFAGTYFTRMAKVDADVNEILSINTAPVANAAWVAQVVNPGVSIAPVEKNSLVQSQYRGISVGGTDFGYAIQTASAPAGQLTFNIRWRSLTTDVPATVVAGLGGAL